MTNVKYWIEAMRLRTLPVSVAGVIAAVGCAVASGCFSAIPATLCLIFAILAQIASNFANEYYDFKAGLDRRGREGPRRGVTEGDITPRGMLTATYATLGAACCVGLSLLAFGGWWLLPVGVGVALGALAYSAGPYPLSRHGLGEVAVILFFGIVPVTCTYLLQGGPLSRDILMMAAAVGLMGANVLIVNNYRDADDDRAVGKHTLAVILGRPTVRALYLINAIGAMLLMMPWWMMLPEFPYIVIPALYTAAAIAIWLRLGRGHGRQLNPLLGQTAVSMLAVTLAFTVAIIFVGG